MNKTPLNTNRANVFYSLTSGLLLTASFPDMGLDLLAWAALLPLLAAIRQAAPGQAFRLGFACGLAHYLTLMYWVAHTMHTYGHLPWYLSIALLFLFTSYLSLYPAVFCWVLIRCAGYLKKHTFLLLLFIPVLWTSLEYLRSFLFTGFPWEQLGYALYQRLHLIQIADIAGVYGLSVLIISGSTALAGGWLCYSKKDWQGYSLSSRGAAGFALLSVAALAGAYGYGRQAVQDIETRMAEAPKVCIAAVQGNIDQGIKWDRSFLYETINKYLALSARAVAESRETVPLVVWPESATPFYYLYHAEPTETMREGLKQIGTRFLFGSPALEDHLKSGDYTVFNSAYLTGAAGNITGRYDKAHLVPFGEYVPLQRFFPFIGKIVAEIGNFKPGKKGGVLNTETLVIGPQICYEIIFPDLSRSSVRNHAQVLVNITNDAWYGRTAAPYQHFSIALFRAVENRRALVRAANTGISGFVDPAGRIMGRTEIFTDAAITREVPLMDRMTFYTRYGDVFAVLITIAAALTVILSIFYRQGEHHVK